MSTSRIIEIASRAEMAELGHRLAQCLFPGAVVALIGGLGAGKTFLVRAIAEGLGADPNRVSSPTFILIQEYVGRLPIYHFDVYRLNTSAEFLDLGSQEYFEGNGVCLIEWADKVADCLPKEYLEIKVVVTVRVTTPDNSLTEDRQEERRIEIKGYGKNYEEIVEKLSAARGLALAAKREDE